MGLFPWDEAFFHVKEKSDKINNLYNLYLHQRDDIGTHGDALTNRLEALQFISGYTNALLITCAVGNMNDDDFHQFLKENELNKPNMVKQPMVAEVMEGIAEISALVSLGETVLKIGQLARLKFFTNNVSEISEFAEADLEDLISEGALETFTDIGLDEAGDLAATSIVEATAEAGAEIGTEVAIEATAAAVEVATISAASVACAAGGIFIAVGLDAAIGAIAGAKESKELDRQTDLLTKGLGVVTGFLAKIDSDKSKAEKYLNEQIASFISVMKVLNAIQPATFTYNFPLDLNFIPQWKAAIQSAAGQYFYIAKVKNDFYNYLNNWNSDNPDMPFSKAMYPLWKKMTIGRRPKSLNEKQAEAFIDFVAARYPEMGQYQ